VKVCPKVLTLESKSNISNLIIADMGKEHVKDLLKFLKPFPAEIQKITLTFREFVWDLYPTSNELIYDNYNAVAFGWSITDKLGHTFCSMAVGRSSHNVHFGFYYGADLSDTKKILLGEGNQYRYILVKKESDFPKAYIMKLLKEAYANSLAKLKPKDKIVEGLTITKSISAAKRPAKKKKSKSPLKQKK
jgi:hypothetical protein